MTLRNKTMAILGAAILALMALLYVSSRTILLDSFARLEDEATRRDVQRVLNAVDNQLRELDTTTDDWAGWDDTYRFMLTRDPAYVESNLVDDTFVTLRLNALLLVDRSGEVVFGRAFDLQDEEEIPVSEALLGHLSPEGLLSPVGDRESHVKGILSLPEGPMLVSSRPILTSQDQGPMRGWLIMARYLDSAETEYLADITDSSLNIQRFDDPSPPTDFGEVRPKLLESPSIVVRPLSADVVAGYGVLRDIYGAPGLVLRVDMPRDIYNHGQSAVTYFWISMLLVGIVFGGIQLATLERQVLRRVGQLTARVARIHSHDDLSARVQVSGQDELSELGSEITSMLERLQSTQADLRRSEERFRRMADNVRDGLTIIEDGRVVYVNDRACEIFGYSGDELKQMQDLDLAAPEDRQRLEPVVQKARQSGEMPGELDFWILRKNGDRRYISNRYASTSHDGAGQRTYVVTTDLTRRKAAEDELERDKERLEVLLEEFPLGVAVIAGDGRYEYVNPRFVDMFGYTMADVPNGREWFKRAYPDEEYRHQVMSFWLQDLHSAQQGERRPRTFTVRCADGTDKVVHFRPVSVKGGDQLVVSEDITERQRAEERIRQLAYHDPLTGLPNRTLFYDRTEIALARARRNGDKLAVLLMDLDHFKDVNDSLGHATGDELLQAVGERLTTLLRESDTICRMGGDEFLILLTGITSVDDVNRIADRVLEAIRKPFVLDDHELDVTTSLGVAIYPDDAEDVDTLIRQTDVAMYLAKERGRDNYQRYSSLDHETQPMDRKARSARREPAQ
ncbi:MAG TPA: diguanylate cyclase [Anaerolineae bacterium]|nr:diguanylate cyclase [Anaerolineae bacterium]